MAKKILGQAAPGATSETTLYTVPGGKEVVASSLVICNRDASPVTVRASCSAGGGGTANKDYIYYDLTLDGNDSFAGTLGLTLAATDVVRVYASTANVSFSLFGDES
jgi:hypothetical protein